MQSFSVKIQHKSEFKLCSIINNQISNQELENLQLSHTLQSPISGNSQSMTENCCFTKINEKIIEEPLLDIQCEQIYSELDNIEYCRQTLVFTNMNELQQAIQKIKYLQNRFVMPINDIQVDKQPDETYKLGIITKKFINHNFRINIRMLSKFILKVIQFDLSFSSNDIIQYYDDSFHINPISLLVYNEKQTYYEALTEMLNQVNICQDIEIILEMLKDFHNQDLEQLISYNIVDKDILKFKLQLINFLYKRMQL
ncbi:unnamed protein product [Paramecium primaurelia]|uniref:Uncharacterized protein n=1 Tax=Paramecium primaurelia TaxID=5886 RepID=A0A8S1PN12_PARPR|nr:unnamed protein product [Paramecium primaurelia]